MCAWVSSPAGDTNLRSDGQSRMTLQTVFPEGAVITKRGGPGHDFWGHPSNAAAQYNHTLDRNGKHAAVYLRPPLSPWRLEVAPPRAAERDYFLHLLHVRDGGAAAPQRPERLSENGRAGARFMLGDRTVTVLFNTSGPLGGILRVTQGEITLLDRALPEGVP
jgi:hypothetical protein